MELQDLQQGDVNYHLCSGGVEILFRRSKVSGGNMDQLQELKVLYGGQET